METENLNIWLHWSSAKLCSKQQPSQIILILTFFLSFQKQDFLDKGRLCVRTNIDLTFDLNIYFNSLHPHCVAQFFSMDWGRRTGGRDWTVLNVLCLSFFVAPAPMFSLFHKRATVFSLFHKKATNWTPTSETSTPSMKDLTVKEFHLYEYQHTFRAYPSDMYLSWCLGTYLGVLNAWCNFVVDE